MIKWTKIAAIVLSSASLATGASADLIAGWDFSQYQVDGSLANGGVTSQLPANYSSLDPNGAGAGAAAAGTMYLDGTFGSSAVSGATNEVVARANDTIANRTAPIDLSSTGVLPINAFDAFTLLAAEGQVNQSRSALTARSPFDVVFRADQGVIATRTWILSFAGFALDPTGPVDVDIEVAPSCGAYSTVTTVTLTAAEQAFEVPLASLTDDDVCVRLGLDTANGQPVIDNVAVPEPTVATLQIAGTLALVWLKRRRSG